MSGLSLQTCMPNLKSIALTQIYTVSTTARSLRAPVSLTTDLCMRCIFPVRITTKTSVRNVKGTIYLPTFLFSLQMNRKTIKCVDYEIKCRYICFGAWFRRKRKIYCQMQNGPPNYRLYHSVPLTLDGTGQPGRSSRSCTRLSRGGVP